MEFRLVIDKTVPEQIVVTAHDRNALVEKIEELVLAHSGTDRIAAYAEDGIQMLTFSQIACVTVLGGKTYAIDSQNRQHRLKMRLYELEEILPSYFIRINKSALANERLLERFAVSYSGAVDAVFKCGYREYVSRRCFAQIKRRFEGK